MKKIQAIIILLLFFALSCRQDVHPKQERETTSSLGNPSCISQEVLESAIAASPQRAAYMANLEDKIDNYKEDPSNLRAPVKLYLPVVIHVVHVDPTIVTDAQIVEQVQVWNTDYNKLSSRLLIPGIYLAGYPLASVANCDIEFYVTDIVRVQTTVVEFQGTTSMKYSSSGGSNAVDATTKLNVWVCNMPGGTSYGMIPGGNPATDGVIIDFAWFGRSSNPYVGRIGTHEVGHWLNLRHIWGDHKCGDDLVADTPEHNEATAGCPAPSLLLRSTCKTKQLVMWMNFMDYTYGNCQYMFTAGQKTRMDATITNARQAYFSPTKIYTDILNVIW